MKIYHNPRCSKSRNTLSALQQKSNNIEVIFYLKTSFKKNEILDILKKLNKNPFELIRKQEKIWKEKYQKRNITDQNEIIRILIKHPILIERPILIGEKFGVIGRDIESIEQFFHQEGI
ncbi:MAG: arsenate reductase [Flavobacteriales bacterium]|nr:arsenate reductase [Flavobacteriales bacterium]|tara:strand:- start:22884 stop:23240 length:357 start_codon:yes stop_codon:yes gene_type:complete